MLKMLMTQCQREYLEFLVNRRLNDLKMGDARVLKSNPGAYNNEIEALTEIKHQLRNATE